MHARRRMLQRWRCARPGPAVPPLPCSRGGGGQGGASAQPRPRPELQGRQRQAGACSGLPGGLLACLCISVQQGRPRLACPVAVRAGPGCWAAAFAGAAQPALLPLQAQRSRTSQSPLQGVWPAGRAGAPGRLLHAGLQQQQRAAAAGCPARPLSRGSGRAGQSSALAGPAQPALPQCRGRRRGAPARAPCRASGQLGVQARLAPCTAACRQQRAAACRLLACPPLSPARREGGRQGGRAAPLRAPLRPRCLSAEASAPEPQAGPGRLSAQQPRCHAAAAAAESCCSKLPCQPLAQAQEGGRGGWGSPCGRHSGSAAASNGAARKPLTEPRGPWSVSAQLAGCKPSSCSSRKPLLQLPLLTARAGPGQESRGRAAPIQGQRSGTARAAGQAG
jgi:hypothetical protein